MFEPKDTEFAAKETIQALKTGQPGSSIWYYQNSNEDFERYIAIDMTMLVQLLQTGKLSDEDLSKVLWAMDRTVAGLVQVFNLTPKNPDFSNKKEDNQVQT